MASYLCTWNPKRWDWEDFDDDYADISAGEPVTFSWRVLSGKIKPGDRLYIMHLGVEPRGIVASGHAASDSYRRDSKPGDRQLLVDFEFDSLRDPESDTILTLDELRDRVDSDYNWTPQGSGVPIPDAVAERLEEAWEGVGETGPVFLIHSEELEEGEIMTEGGSVEILVNAYERNRAARKACIDHYGTACSVCGFDFSVTYGSDHKGIIHVHHLTPLSEIDEEYTVDPIKDLRPVCPNCHAAIHAKTPPYTIKQIKKRLTRTKS